MARLQTVAHGGSHQIRCMSSYPTSCVTGAVNAEKLVQMVELFHLADLQYLTLKKKFFSRLVRSTFIGSQCHSNKGDCYKAEAISHLCEETGCQCLVAN